MGTAALEGLKIPHNFQLSLIVLLSPQQKVTKPVGRCNHTTWFLVDHWAASHGYSQQELRSVLLLLVLLHEVYRFIIGRKVKMNISSYIHYIFPNISL